MGRLVLIYNLVNQHPVVSYWITDGPLQLLACGEAGREREGERQGGRLQPLMEVKEMGGRDTEIGGLWGEKGRERERKRKRGGAL